MKMYLISSNRYFRKKKKIKLTFHTQREKENNRKTKSYY